MTIRYCRGTIYRASTKGQAHGAGIIGDSNLGELCIGNYIITVNKLDINKEMG